MGVRMRNPVLTSQLTQVLFNTFTEFFNKESKLFQLLLSVFAEMLQHNQLVRHIFSFPSYLLK